MSKPANRLAGETSPYLLQHQHNPVDWFPWCGEALRLAREQDKPILLSIGYSACHWCHVMAHESFEDAETAALMNDYFVNIKVDREERPDLDKIYQLAHQLLSRRGGGWPLTVFLMPHDQTPFFAGTYFPPDDRHGLRSFRFILQAVHDAYHQKRNDIEQQNQSLRDHLQQINQCDSRHAELSDDVFTSMAEQLLSQFDAAHGGFTPQPKFPHAYFIERCLRQYARYGSKHAELLEAGLFSAQRMVRGGLFDQIGGGFCRYSTDEYWMIPHFEKMLYDNGQLMPLYAWAHQLRPGYYFERAVTLTAEWLMREMQSDAGGYYSAQDADSEGEEGRFYVWLPQQVSAVLDDKDYALFEKAFGLDRAANFEGHWYPHGFRSIAQLSSEAGLSEQAVRESLERSRRQLLQVRSQRIKPATDDKILTSWNALMIRGMLIAGRVLNRPQYTQSALRALDFIRQQLWLDDHLLATWKDGKAHLNAYLDDYAYLLLAAIEALQTRWNTDTFAWCLDLGNCLIDRFANEERGGFFFTSRDHEALLLRSQTFNDDAMPSGNAIAAQSLFYLGYLSGESRYLDYAERTVNAASLSLTRQPMGHAAMFNAVDIKLHAATIIVLRGPRQQMMAWREQVDKRYLPDVLCVAIDGDTQPPPQLGDKKAVADGVTAYICEGMSCKAPVTELNDFARVIDAIYKA